MKIILGASGQIGGAVARILAAKGNHVRAVVRNRSKCAHLDDANIEIVEADMYDKEALLLAFRRGETAFLLTPENFQSNDFSGDLEKLLENYRYAVSRSGVRKLVGLSSMGAERKEYAGYLWASHRLEHHFSDLNVKQTFLRPAFYFSNWYAYKPLADAHGVLPSMIPGNLRIPAVAPIDVAKFLAEMILNDDPEPVYEIAAREKYTPQEIADTFSRVLNKPVRLQEIPESEWEPTLIEAGFSHDAARQMAFMTKSLVDGSSDFTTANPIVAETTFKEYLEQNIST